MQLVHASRRALSAALPLLISIVPSAAHAGHYEDGMAALDRWEVARASTFFDMAARDGDGRGLYDFVAQSAGPDWMDLRRLERAAALDEPRAVAWLGRFQLFEIPGRHTLRVAFGGSPAAVPHLLATACNRKQFDACGLLAQLHAGKLPEEAEYVGFTGGDMAQARHWGDIWRAGRLAEARTGNARAVSEIVLHGADAWSGIDPATLAFYRVVDADLNGDGSSAPGGQTSPDADLRSKVDAWEIEQGLRPARLPEPLVLARRIAAFEALDEQIDAEIVAASGRYLAAEALTRAGYKPIGNRPWGSDLVMATAVATREAEAFLHGMESTRRTRGLDIETWLPARLVATFNPMQLYVLDQARSTSGAKKRAAASRLLRTAAIDGDGIMERLRGDPGMAFLGGEEHARRSRYVKDRDIDLGTVVEPMIRHRDRLLVDLLRRLHIGDRHVRLGQDAWTRASAMLTRTDVREIRMTLDCGHCRGVLTLLEELAAAREKDAEIAKATGGLRRRVTISIHNAGLPLIKL
jgi:hypothetical protein